MEGKTWFLCKISYTKVGLEKFPWVLKSLIVSGCIMVCDLGNYKKFPVYNNCKVEKIWFISCVLFVYCELLRFVLLIQFLGWS